MKIRIIIGLVTFFIAFRTNGQSHYLLSRLEAFKSENRVIINWNIRQGGSCFGIGILRSTDQVHYDVIGEIFGNCGSSESEQTFSFIDENPVKNKINYYVLEMGFSGRSAPPLTIEYYDLGKNNSKVIPNPLTLNGKILFINPSNTKHTILIFDQTGRIVKSALSYDDFFIPGLGYADDFSHSELKKYFYIIQDENGTKISSGQFVGANE